MTTATVAAAIVGGALLLCAAADADTRPSRVAITFPPPPTVPAGTAVVMPIRVTNGWSGKAVGVKLTVTTPPWVELSAPRCRARPGTLTCALGDLGGRSARTVRVTVTPSHEGSYKVTARVMVKKILIPVDETVRTLASVARFQGSAAPISATLARRMTGVSWRPGCPVALRDLRAVTVSYWGFDGAAHVGTLIVHRTVAAPVVRIMRRLFDARFPIRRMTPVDAYGGDDFRSIEADNTSAFNCRPVAGTSRWSEHAYGRAIDLDPLENPYVSGGRTSHTGSRRYLDRSLDLRGMIRTGDPVVKAFAAEGWGWGGTWSGDRDYQHFSASGR